MEMVADVTAKHRVAFPGAAFLAKRDVRHSDMPSAAGLSSLAFDLHDCMS